MTKQELKEKHSITLLRTGKQEYEVSRHNKVVGWLWREYEPLIGIGGKTPDWTWFFETEKEDWQRYRHSSFKEALAKLPEHIGD